MTDYGALRGHLAGELRRDAKAHRERRFEDIGRDYRELGDDVWDALPPDDPILIAQSFSDGWKDARNHDWLYYPGIEQDDWPKFADSLASCLEYDVKIQDPVLLHLFAFKQSEGVVKRFLSR